MPFQHRDVCAVRSRTACSITATCLAAGIWQVTSNTCSPSSAGTCIDAPDVPGGGLDSAKWGTDCGSTTRGNACSSTACDNGSSASITATCDLQGRWDVATGSCTQVLSG
ncbi:hypothetical protein OEZ86_008453 [Tetradesmus obliquus]|nr:hypothetical protein OEZ86_008453 [Tetradesmus obliquus]